MLSDDFTADESDDVTANELFGTMMQRYQHALEMGDFDEASGAVHDFFALIGEWCKENPSTDFELNTAAGEFEERGEWDAAELAYNQILALPELEPIVEYKARSNLSSLCSLLGRNLDALSHSQYATASARRTNLVPLLAFALGDEASCWIRCGQYSKAEDAIAEAISAIDHDTKYNQTRASLLTLRAECAIHNDALVDAQGDLSEAFSLLGPMTRMDIAAGVHRDLSRWWSVMAELRAKHNDHEGTVTAWQKAVKIAKHVASLPHADNVYSRAAVANALKGLVDALLRCGCLGDAAAAFDERNAILQSIGVPNTDAA